MKLVAQAWDELPGWDKLSRTLALEMAMEAGDGERARKWIDEAGLRAPESDIYEAWVKLVEGDIMAALADLAALPQEHPHVALLQGLALVEQNRYAEAQPWLDRADKLLPGPRSTSRSPAPGSRPGPATPRPRGASSTPSPRRSRSPREAGPGSARPTSPSPTAT